MWSGLATCSVQERGISPGERAHLGAAAGGRWPSAVGWTLGDPGAGYTIEVSTLLRRLTRREIEIMISGA